MSKLTAEEIEEIHEVFKETDKDHDGKIDKSELQGLVKIIGLHITDSDLEKAVKTADTNASGKIEFREFMDIICEALHRNVDELGASEMRRQFKIFDKSGDGKISKDEMKKACEGMGLRYTDTQLARFMKSADTDGDGNINYEEFINDMTKDE